MHSMVDLEASCRLVGREVNVVCVGSGTMVVCSSLGRNIIFFWAENIAGVTGHLVSNVCCNFIKVVQSMAVQNQKAYKNTFVQQGSK